MTGIRWGTIVGGPWRCTTCGKVYKRTKWIVRLDTSDGWVLALVCPRCSRSIANRENGK